MISHIYIGVNDFPRAFAFYEPLLGLIGWLLKFREDDHPWAGWKVPDRDRPLLVLGKPFDGGPASPGNGQMVALLATSRGMVDEVYRMAIENGASCEGPPGLRPDYHANYYGAYFRDPEGNKLCICCHNEEPHS